MYIKHSGGNEKLRIFSFIGQRQRVQPNFMTNFKNFHTSKSKHNLDNQNNEISFTSITKFVLLQVKQRKFLSIYIQTLQ